MSWASLFKGAKATLTFIEVVDGVADAATLGDEIAKAAMGDDYDPGFRDKCQAVADAGKRVDKQVALLKSRQDDSANLFASLNQLNISLDTYEGKQEVAVDLVDKIGAFTQAMAQVPSAMLWTQGPAAVADAHRSQEEVIKGIEEVSAYMSTLQFSPTNVAFLSSALTLKGAITAYKLRQRYRDKNKNGMDIDANDIEMDDLRPRQRRSRSNAFSGMESLPKADQKAIKSLRKRFTKAQAVDVVSKVGSAISLGYTIKNIVTRVQGRADAMKAFDEQLNEYQKSYDAYKYAIEGYKSSSNQLLKEPSKAYLDAVARIADADPIDDDFEKLEQDFDVKEKAFSKALDSDPHFKAAKEFFSAQSDETWSEADNVGFALGIEGLIEDYNDRGDKKIEALRNIFKEMSEVLTGESDTANAQDRKVQEYVRIDGVIDDLAAKRQHFENLAVIASNRLNGSATRKDDGFEPIQNTFNTSLQVLMSRVIKDASVQLRNVRFANQLYVAACTILKRAKDEETAVESRNSGIAEENQKLREFLENQGAAPERIEDFMKTEEKFDLDAFVEKEISDTAQNEWTASDLDTDPTDRFPDAEAAQVCLELMIKDLKTVASRHVTDDYVWLNTMHELPLRFSCEFTSGENAAFIPCFSAEQKRWGQGDLKCLSWFVSTNRNDFTFRTGLFADFPEVTRPTKGFNTEPGRKYTMRCEIGPRKATYWIDGKRYATATYPEKEVPKQGYLGFAVYGKTDVRVDQILVRSGA